MADENEPIRIETDDARSGETTGAMRYVLLISLVLVIVIFAYILIV